jgi:DNA-binding Lrp family transcriptional regulator
MRSHALPPCPPCPPWFKPFGFARVNALDFRLLNEFQRNWPLVPRPYAAVGERLGVDESWVLERLTAFQRDGAVSRVGAVFAPGTVGASTLAALEVPAERLNEVADIVSAFPEVNHNYEREHRINLWFVVTAQDEDRLTQVLAGIERRAQCGPLLALRLEEEFRIDLGFDLNGEAAPPGLSAPRPVRAPQALTAPAVGLIAALQDGLPLVPRPFAALGETAGLDETQALEQIRHWIAAGVIRRLGVIVRHRELGYRANAMVVWDVPDGLLQPMGIHLAQQAGVTLCYRRTRARPRWPYNLYCMIHGRGRETVVQRIESIGARTGLQAFAHQVLFSRTRFKQTGARYVLPEELSYG